LQSNAAHAGEHAALERLLADREASIADLRRRLDASEAERRQLSERLHGLLTVKRDGASNEAPAAQNDSQTASHANRNASNEAPPSLTGEEAAPSASSGLAIPRPPWWRRWFRYAGCSPPEVVTVTLFRFDGRALHGRNDQPR
jgi:hypothetical protein